MNTNFNSNHKTNKEDDYHILLKTIDEKIKYEFDSFGNFPF